MHPISNIVLSTVVGFAILFLYAVLPPQLYFTLLGGGAVAYCIGQNKDKDTKE